jgi:cation transport protein ChaC
MSAKPLTNVSRWVTVRSECQTFGAITFIANRSGPAYAAPHPEEMTVEGLALAAGHLGQLDYLRKVALQLESHQIRDTTL